MELRVRGSIVPKTQQAPSKPSVTMLNYSN
jgi:hypothetical protein